MNDLPEQVPIFTGDGTSYLPLAYVCTALSSLGADDRTIFDGWCGVIDRAAAPREGGPSSLRVHHPFRVSPPWDDDRSPEEIYAANWTYLATEVDGLILFIRRGGSIGCGQELAWAQAMCLPVLVLGHGRDPRALGEGERNLENADRLSRQLEGTASRADLEVHWFADTERLEAIVRDWFERKAALMSDRHRLRRMHRQRAAVPLAVLNAAAARLGADAPREVAAQTQLHPGRVEQLLGGEDALLAASLEELYRLSTGLGVDLGEALTRRQAKLQPRQLQALAEAAVENEWPPQRVIDAVERGQTLLAVGGVRRLPLGSAEGWVELMERPST